VLSKTSAGFCRFRRLYLPMSPVSRRHGQGVQTTARCAAVHSAHAPVHRPAQASASPGYLATPTPPALHNRSETPPANAGAVRAPPAPTARR